MDVLSTILDSPVELPPPATHCTISQTLSVNRRLRTWAWLVICSFYDDQGRELWHTEILLGRRIPLTDIAEAFERGQRRAAIEPGTCEAFLFFFPSLSRSFVR